MKNISFKTAVLLSAMLVVLTCLSVFSCKKKVPVPPVQLSFKNLHIKLGGTSSSSGAIIGRFSDSRLQANLNEYFAGQSGGNVDLTLPTSILGSASGGMDDMMLITLEVEEGATVEVSKQEKKGNTDTTAFAFGVGKITGSSSIQSVTGLPSTLINANGQKHSLTDGNVIAIQLKTTYANLTKLLSNQNNRAVLTVTASKEGRTNTTKTLTVKGSGSSK